MHTADAEAGWSSGREIDEDSCMVESSLELATLPGAWREDLGNRPPDVVWRYEIPLELSAADAWEVLVDTSALNEALNEALGLSRFDLVERGGLAHAVQRHLGIVYDWAEPPWSWVEGRSIAALRRYRRGPAQAAVIRYTLLDAPYRAMVEIGFWVRSVVARWFLGLARHTFRVRYERGLSRMTALRLSRALPAATRAAVRVDDLARTARAAVASGGDPRAIETLSSLLTESDDASLVRMRPRAIARTHALDEDATLLACLHGTRSGMLELVWDVVCPHCRGVRRSLRHLGDVPDRVRCEPCGIDVSTSAEHAIEVTFRPDKAKASLQAVEKLRQRAQILFGIGGIKRLDTKREVLTKGAFQTLLQVDRILLPRFDAA